MVRRHFSVRCLQNLSMIQFDLLPQADAFQPREKLRTQFAGTLVIRHFQRSAKSKFAINDRLTGNLTRRSIHATHLTKSMSRSPSASCKRGQALRSSHASATCGRGWTKGKPRQASLDVAGTFETCIVGCPGRRKSGPGHFAE